MERNLVIAVLDAAKALMIPHDELPTRDQNQAWHRSGTGVNIVVWPGAIAPTAGCQNGDEG
jgi:hypothetical protein